MRKIPGENLTANGKSSKNKTPSKGKTMFGYNVLGFGAGGGAAKYNIDWLIVAGGGGGGSVRNSGSNYLNGGGGGGGSINSTTNQEVTVGNAITVTVGDGAPGRPNPVVIEKVLGGTSSVASADFTTVSRTGGGSGTVHNNTQGSPAAHPAVYADGGGSGGGGNYPNAFGLAGPDGGNNGGTGTGSSPYAKGGGGGNGAVGQNAGSNGGNGGAGSPNSITGSAVTYAGGGGGGGSPQFSSSGSSGGSGGGGDGESNQNGQNGTANTGGGGGGAGGTGDPSTPNFVGGTGGKGIVILRVPTANFSNTTTGSPTVTTDGDFKVISFTGSGSYTA